MKILKLVFINALIFILLLLIVDPFLPQAMSTKTNRYIRLREPRPNMEFVFQMTEDESIRFMTDENGFYISENSAKNPMNPDIMFFGGSTTECIGIQESKRFPFMISQMLNDTISNSNIKTINAGLSGNNVMHSLTSFIAKGIPLKPKMVFLMHNINDLSQLLKTGSYWRAPEGRSIIVDQTNGNFQERARNYLKSSKDFFIPNTYSLVKKAIKFKGGSDDEWENYREGEVHSINKILTAYERALKSFVKVAKANDIKVVLMTQFHRFSIGDEVIRGKFDSAFKGLEYETFCDFYKQFNNKIRQVAMNESIDFIDLEEKIKPAEDYLFDYVHLNESGSELVSKEISEWLSNKFPQYRLN